MAELPGSNVPVQQSAEQQAPPPVESVEPITDQQGKEFIDQERPLDDGIAAPANMSTPAVPAPPAPAMPAPPVSAEPLQSAPPAVPTPADDDISAQYANDRQAMSGDAAVAQAESMFGGGASRETATPATPGAPTTAGKVASGAKGVALDIWHGIGEAPSQVMGGVQAAARSMHGLAEDVFKWMETNKGLLPTKLRVPLEGAKALGEVAPEGTKEQLLEPGTLTHEPATVSGGLIRGAAQFLAPFGMAGKALRSVEATGAAATVAKGAVQGAIADFTAFEGHEKNLANLIKDYTEFKNPVLDFLATSPKDSDAANRLKTALTGLGVGAVAEGMVKGLSYIRLGRSAQAMEDLAKGLAGEEAVARVKPLAPETFHPLGDVEAPLIGKRETEKLAEGEAAAAGRKPSDITGKPKKEPEHYINFAKIDTEDDVKTVIKKMAQMDKKAIDGEARGVRTWKDTAQSAEKVDAWNMLMERRTGAPLNAEESVAARDLWAASGEKLKEMATLAKEAPSEANIFMFRKMVATHYAIQKEVLAARTETARALQSWAMPVGSSAKSTNELARLLEANGGATWRETGLDLADKISRLGEGGRERAMEQFVNGTAFARTRDAISQVWINALLSNPQTHVANALSNMGAAAQQVYERFTAEYLAKTLGTANSVELGESLAMVHGAMMSFREGMTAMAQKIKTKGVGKTALDVVDSGATVDSAAKFEVSAGNHLAAEKWGIASDTNLGRALDVANAATNAPGRLLSKADDVFKSLGYRMELHAQAVRLARREMRSGEIGADAFKARVAAIIENPPSDVHIEAVNQATYQTFQSKPAETLAKLGNGIQSIPLLGRLLLPFKNTPINILTYSTERSPLAPLVKSWRADIAAGGSRKDIALSRMATGTMIMSLGMDLALQGHITGKGPQSNNEKALERREQIPPYSVRVPGTKSWLSINRFDPVGMTLGIAADMAEAILNAEHDVSEAEFQKAMVPAIFAISNNVLSKTYMQGTAEFFGAVTNAQQLGDRYVNRMVGSMVPAGVAAITRNGIPGILEGDPYMRAATDAIDTLKSRLPILSRSLPPSRDLWGRVIPYQSGKGWAYDMFSPLYLKTETPEPIDKELKSISYFPDMPDKKVRVKGVAMELSPADYSRMVELAGNGLKHPAWGLGAKDFLNQLVTGKHGLSGVYQLKKQMDEKEGTSRAKEFLRSWIEDYRDKARKQVMRESADLQAKFDEKTKLRPGRIPAKTLFSY